MTQTPSPATVLGSATMSELPLKLSACLNAIGATGLSWTVEDEDELARLVGRIYLGHFLHVEKILKRLNTAYKPVDGQAAEEAKARLVVKEGSDPWHRDGLLFQAISWIAAHQAAEGKSSVFSVPHMIPAHKGFDGLEIETANDTELLRLVVFEDKATEHPRDTIRNEVWPEIKALHEGQRQTELMQELTALLQRAQVSDPDAVIEKTIWKQVRNYRVSITGNDGHDKEKGFNGLFKGFDEITPGLDHSGRRAEVFCHSDIRAWMASFALRVSAAIDAEKGNLDV